MNKPEPQAWPGPLPGAAAPPLPTRAHAPQEEASRGTNGYAIASIVLGVLGIVFWLPLVGSVLLLGA